MSVLTSEEQASSPTGTQNPARVVPAPNGPADQAVLVSTLSQHAIDAHDAPLNQGDRIPSWLNREPEIWQLAPVVMLIIWTLIRLL